MYDARTWERKSNWKTYFGASHLSESLRTSVDTVEMGKHGVKVEMLNLRMNVRALIFKL